MSATPRGPAAVLFHRLGPYHVARLGAAAERGPVVCLELSARSGEYAWDAVATAGRFDRVTLTTDDAGLPPAEMSVRVRAALTACRPAVVFVNGWFGPWAMSALGWCLKAGVPAVVMSESTASDAPRADWREAVKGRVVRCFSAALVGGTAHAEYAVRLGLPADRVFRGYDAVDNDHFATGADVARGDPGVRTRLGLPPRYFLASSRFVEKKNLHGLLHAFARYRAAIGGDGCELVLLGDGPLRPAVEQLRADLGLTASVSLPGFKQYAELPAYYGLAEAFVHASTAEQWGLVVNEAMAAGLPVVVSNRCGCAPDLVLPGVTGYQFDPADPAALATLLARLTADPTERATLGTAARRVVEKFSPRAFADGFWAAASAARAVAVGPLGRAGVSVVGRWGAGRVG